jgi:hypothetical protein
MKEPPKKLSSLPLKNEFEKKKKKKKVTVALGPRGTRGVSRHHGGAAANAERQRLELGAGHVGKPLLQVAQQRFARRTARHEVNPVANADELPPSCGMSRRCRVVNCVPGQYVSPAPVSSSRGSWPRPQRSWPGGSLRPWFTNWFTQWPRGARLWAVRFAFVATKS